MWSNQTSIKSVVERKSHFRPPFCPNEHCKLHQSDGSHYRLFHKYGSRPIKRFPYTSFRFRCSLCGRTFSESFFSLSYRDRKSPIYEQIFDLSRGGYSKREIASFLHCSLDTVLRKHSEIARQCLLKQAKKTTNLKIQEAIAFDGIENFSFSQFDPNNINHAIGKESYFVYDFNFSPMNRKGRLTPKQRRRKQQLNNMYGPYPQDEIFQASRRIFRRLASLSEAPLVLHTDGHHAYQKAIETLRPFGINHRITMSRVARNFQNRLFPINHLDLLTRHHLAAFRRETIAFAKHSIAMIESFSILMVWKNFMRPIFSKKHRRDPMANTQSPAMRLGLSSKILSFAEFFKTRILKTQVSLNSDWERFIDRLDPLSRRKISKY